MTLNNDTGILNDAAAVAEAAFAGQLHDDLSTALRNVEWVLWQGNAVAHRCVACGAPLVVGSKALTCHAEQCRTEFRTGCTPGGKLALVNITRAKALLDAAGVIEATTAEPPAPGLTRRRWLPWLHSALITVAAVALVYAVGR